MPTDEDGLTAIEGSMPEHENAMMAIDVAMTEDDVGIRLAGEVGSTEQVRR